MDAVFFGRKGGDDGRTKGPKILRWPGTDRRGRDRKAEKILQRVIR